jgi:hypothetical protein
MCATAKRDPRQNVTAIKATRYVFHNLAMDDENYGVIAACGGCGSADSGKMFRDERSPGNGTADGNLIAGLGVLGLVDRHVGVVNAGKGDPCFMSRGPVERVAAKPVPAKPLADSLLNKEREFESVRERRRCLECARKRGDL